MANNKAVAVKVFSPPLNCVIEEGRFPLGFAMISMPVSGNLSQAASQALSWFFEVKLARSESSDRDAVYISQIFWMLANKYR